MDHMGEVDMVVEDKPKVLHKLQDKHHKWEDNMVAAGMLQD